LLRTLRVQNEQQPYEGCGNDGNDYLHGDIHRGPDYNDTPSLSLKQMVSIVVVANPFPWNNAHNVKPVCPIQVPTKPFRLDGILVPRFSQT
jgi:hypothetical protein